MRTRSAAKRPNNLKPLHENEPIESDGSEGNRCKGRAKGQSIAVGHSKEKVNLEVLKDSSESDSFSYSSGSHESDDSDLEERKVQAKEETKDELRFTLKEIRKFIADSEFKGKLEVNTEPYSSTKILRKPVLSFNTATLLCNDQRADLSTGANIILSNNVVGRLRQVKSIELQIVGKRLTAVVIQTEVFATCEDVREEAEEWVKALKGVLGKKGLESYEAVKVVGAGLSSTAVTLDAMLKNLHELKSAQLCKSEDELAMKRKLNSSARIFLCNKEFHIQSKELLPLLESSMKEGADTEKDLSEASAKKVSYGKKDAMLKLYDDNCRSLELNALPDYLPCREKERSEIHEFVKMGVITNGSATSLYISGMPGTGKTATVLEVIRRLKEDVEKKVIPKFEFININGMSIGNIYMVYSLIYKNLTGINATSSQAILFLDKFFKRKKLEAKKVKSPGMVRVILIDELDGLFTKKQDLLYNLFDWPSYAQARLVMIGIANTMNLPEELQGKIASRIGCKRLVYEPYNKDQIQTILDTRVSRMGLFEADAVRYISSKVAALSGDMRRCLQIAKRSIEVVRKVYLESESDDPIKVHIEHLVAAGNELFNSKVTALIKCLTEYEVLVLGAIVLERTHARIDVIKKQRLYQRTEQVINKVGRRYLKGSEIDYICLLYTSPSPRD
eukprot:TRINITY_DN12935_c0_g1_i11.p1 TRINITY_DN12935_c0_g1~~TRINITY_DN12935_c0_g1_i11.p1  ORF type:complete len:686 (-),score=206.29 TRINITY_DN12935_c0_g1_i11:55-2079(-)